MTFDLKFSTDLFTVVFIRLRIVSLRGHYTHKLGQVSGSLGQTACLQGG